MFQAFTRTVLAVAILISAAHAQQTTATLTGTVTDPTGAVVAGVTITATNLATNAVRETLTAETGSYTLPFLPAGDYSVTAVAPGFQKQKIDRITLQVQQTARVDVQLRIGDVAETINVEAFAAVLQTDNATVGAVIDGNKIVDLPLNGRNFVQLAQLIPGVQAGTPGSITVRRGRGSIGQQDAPFGSTAMSANGSRDTANRYLHRRHRVHGLRRDDVLVCAVGGLARRVQGGDRQLVVGVRRRARRAGQYAHQARRQSAHRHPLGVQSQRRAHAGLRCDRPQERRPAPIEPESVRREYRRAGLYSWALPRNGQDVLLLQLGIGPVGPGRGQFAALDPAGSHPDRRFPGSNQFAHRGPDYAERPAQHRDREQCHSRIEAE